MKRFIPAAMTTLLIAALCACAARQYKAAVPMSAVPSEEVSKLEKDIETGYSDQLDVLANREFARAQTWLKQAQQDLSRDAGQKSVIDDVAYGKGYLQRAQEVADQRRQKVQGVLDARARAIQAGAKNYRPETDRMRKLDNSLRADIGGTINVSSYNQLMTDYMDLELSAIQSSNLESARAKVNAAIRDGARKNTPRTLKQAEIEITNANNMIAANRHHRDSFQPQVARANQAAELLMAVLDASKRPGKRLPEDAALDMVRSGRKISSLERQLGAAEQQQQELTQNLSTKAQALNKIQQVQKVEQALETARKEFSSDEAEVYRQGEKLLIRLKTMNFPSGRAELPATSLPILAKIKSITDDLKPQQIVIEGHTDSTGSARTNLELSEQRAHSVAEYLQTTAGLPIEKIQAVGKGFQKPLATNKTSSGRAQNRRVDVIITPGAM